jgi:DNA-binding transcriptional ArsR family regulator
MDREWKIDLQSQNGAIASLPPAMIGETGWDVLLALSMEEQSGLSLDRLAPLVSVSGSVLGQWLDWLEDRELVASGRRRFTHEIGVIITRAGRELVENYLLAASGLQGRVRH